MRIKNNNNLINNDFALKIFFHFSISLYCKKSDAFL